MSRLLPQTLLGLVGVALLGQVATSHVMGAASNPSADPTSYIVQPEADQPAAEIDHGYFSLVLKAGQSKTLRIVIKNTSKSVLRISNYPADATQIAAGGIDFGVQHKQFAAAGGWITVQPKDLTLAPGEARRITATITIPKSVKAGDFVGGVAMENKAVQGTGTGSHVLIDVHYRKVIAILDSVPGVRWAAANVAGVALNPAFRGAQAVVSVRNTGNTLLHGKGTVTIIGSKSAMQQFAFKIDTILPSQVAKIPLYLPNLTLQPGTYSVRVQLDSVRNVPLAIWRANVGFMRGQHSTPAAPIKPVLLQPAQGAPQQVDVQGTPGGLPLGVWVGGMLALVLVCGSGGILLGRRSTAPRP
jgi:hypothetical protein